MQVPTFLPYFAALCCSLFVCVLMHLFIRGRSLSNSKAALAKSHAEIGPTNCRQLIQDQIALIQSFPHPSPQGKKSTAHLAELLLSARLYHPSSKDYLDAFAGRLQQVYEDEGLLLMALMDLRKWLASHLENPEIS